MDEMQKLYDAKEYDQVVELLLKAVTQPSQKPMVGIFCLIIKLKFFFIIQLCKLENCIKWKEIVYLIQAYLDCYFGMVVTSEHQKQ